MDTELVVVVVSKLYCNIHMTSAHVYIKKQAHNIIDEKTVHTIHTHKMKT